MVYIDRRTRDKSPTPSTPESMRARYHRDHLHHFLRPPSLDSSPAFYRDAAARSGSTRRCLRHSDWRNVDAFEAGRSSTLGHDPVSRHVAKGTGGINAAAPRAPPRPPILAEISHRTHRLRFGLGSGSGCIEGHTKGLRGPGSSVGARNTSRGRGYHRWEGCTPRWAHAEAFTNPSTLAFRRTGQRP